MLAFLSIQDLIKGELEKHKLYLWGAELLDLMTCKIAGAAQNAIGVLTFPHLVLESNPEVPRVKFVLRGYFSPFKSQLPSLTQQEMNESGHPTFLHEYTWKIVLALFSFVQITRLGLFLLY